MNSVRFHPALAGAAALALVLSAPAFAQQQTQGTQPVDPASTAQVTAENATNAGAAGQVVQQLEQAQQALEAGDMEAAREAVGQANEMLQKAMVEGSEEQLLEIQAQLEQANTALEQEDAEAAQAALGAAAEAMIVVEERSAAAGTGQGQAAGQTAGQDQATMQATGQAGQQQAGQQTSTQAAVVPGSMQGGDQMSQEAVWNAQDALEMARQELEAAMRSVEEAQAALQQVGSAGAQGTAQLTVVEGGSTNAPTNAQTNAQGQPAAGQAEGRMPRLSQEDTYRMLGVGDRQVGEAAEMRQITIADIDERDVYTFEGEKLGEIDQFVTSGGQVYAIIEHGGFLGIGEDKVAIPANRLGMRGDEVILLGLTEEQLEQMPEYDYAAGEELGQEEPFEIGIYN